MVSGRSSIAAPNIGDHPHNTGLRSCRHCGQTPGRFHLNDAQRAFPAGLWSPEFSPGATGTQGTKPRVGAGEEISAHRQQTRSHGCPPCPPPTRGTRVRRRQLPPLAGRPDGRPHSRFHSGDNHTWTTRHRKGTPATRAER